jgi:murein L,D-transpeptidase YcbB/YkuD
MPATGHELARRAFLMALAAPLLADTRQEILDLITELASALSEGNGLAFLDHIDRAMPDYQKLQQSILALTEQNEVSAAIDILKQEGDDRTQTVELDWLMQIRSREDSGPIERRRETVKCRAERKKKNWKIVSLEPIALFAPPAVR